jgi:glycosyltransferase involved in cell wall biosynthesis
MRVLILADDCNPEWPSLPVVGYNAVRAIAEYAKVVVATQVRNRANIEKAGLGRAEVRFIDNDYVARPMHQLAKRLRGGTQVGWTTAIAFAYPGNLAFEREVWKAFRGDLRRGAFDVVHRLTPMSPTLPSPMATWSPVPFILGPLNGGLKWPPQFREELAREREWLSYLRRAHRLLPYLHSTYEHASAVLAAFRHTTDDVPKSARARLIDFPEIGVDPKIFGQSARRRPNKQKVVLFVGRLVPYKLPQLLVRAFAQRPVLRSHRLVIVGDGPERPAIEELIRSHGLESQIELHGWKSQTEVGDLMRQADIFAFPSIRELGAGALLEAMACGLACIVVDYGAPGTLIDTDRGIKVPLGSKDEITRDFGIALERLVADPETAARLGAAAREHAMRFYAWDAKARKTREVYEWVLGRGPRPDFWADGRKSFGPGEGRDGLS